MTDKRWEIYHKNFWGEDPLSNGMLKSARAILPIFFEHIGFVPESVVDIGCGHGAWLYACKELGVGYTIGVDGPWIQGADIPDIYNVDFFIGCDLEKEKIQLPVNINAAICLEVAEYVSDNGSINLMESLNNSSDTVLFSSATPGQGGEHHINEQPDDYWDKKFDSYGYKPDYSIKDNLKKLTDVDKWYIKNTRIYKK